VIWYTSMYYRIVRCDVLPCVLQCIAVDCVVLQSVAVIWYTFIYCHDVRRSVLPRVLQCISVDFSVL